MKNCLNNEEVVLRFYDFLIGKEKEFNESISSEMAIAVLQIIRVEFLDEDFKEVLEKASSVVSGFDEYINLYNRIHNLRRALNQELYLNSIYVFGKPRVNKRDYENHQNNVFDLATDISDSCLMLKFEDDEYERENFLCDLSYFNLLRLSLEFFDDEEKYKEINKSILILIENFILSLYSGKNEYLSSMNIDEKAKFLCYLDDFKVSKECTGLHLKMIDSILETLEFSIEEDRKKGRYKPSDRKIRKFLRKSKI